MIRFYNLETGRVLPGMAIYPNEADLLANTPAGHAPITLPEGFDPKTQRVDVESLEVVACEPEPLPDEVVEERARQRRDTLLSASDWVTLRALDTGSPVPQAWRQYRQFLRDAPQQSGWPRDVVWPEIPIDA